MKSNKGFTLIELMIVVAIIAIIAAIAIPSLLASRVSANENAAIGNVRTVIGAQTQFSGRLNRYADSFAELANPPGGAAVPFLDDTWNNDPVDNKSGYDFTMGGAGNANTFTVAADPDVVDTTGVRGFFADQTGVIRHNIGGGATAADVTIDTAL